MAPDGAALDEPVGGARRVEQEVRGEGRDAVDRRAGKLPGMHEDDGAPAVQLREERLVLRRAQIAAVRVGEEDHARGAEGVERVAGLLERPVDVGQRERGEEAEARRMVLRDPRQELVRAACHGARLPVAPPARVEVNPRRGDGQDRRRDLLLVHETERVLGRPLRERAPAGVPDPRAAQPLGVRGGQRVVVDVDSPVGHGTSCPPALIDL
jgi:hypothetical protein